MDAPTDFLRTIREGEFRLQSDAERALYEGYLGIRGTGAYGALGLALELLSGIAGCRWGCKHPEHHLERLLRRFVNACFASLRLSFAGYNDEAIALMRIAAEMGNLLQLFDRDLASHSEWLGFTARERRKRYSPVSVRKALVAAGSQPFFDEKVYCLLSESGVHLSPESVKASHDLESNKLWVGPMVSVPSILMMWCELGFAAGSILSLSTIVQMLDADHRVKAGEATQLLKAAIGDGELRIANYQHIRAWFQKYLATGEDGSLGPFV